MWPGCKRRPGKEDFVKNHRLWVLISFLGFLNVCGVLAQTQAPVDIKNQQWLEQMYNACLSYETCPAVEVPNPRYDPLKLEIAGFHLFMDSQDALRYAEQKFHLSPRSCSANFPPCLGFSKRPAEFTPDASVVKWIQIYIRELNIDLYFTESYPFDPKHPSTLTKIIYSPTNLVTDADAAAFVKMVTDKYGVPDEIYDRHSETWCAQAKPEVNYDHWPERETPNVYDFKFLNWKCEGVPYFHLGGISHAPDAHERFTVELGDGDITATKEKARWETERKSPLPTI